ncbi:hypothetical protein K1T71_001690 [Dendrolimus kikuchii]|uniref:Uncharacterized protein n=1 Tax=Dendrolimus kikuchii TaxID=765133 RepID=A0ACC1DEM8_9NEOP|nr:hypothetical protein K1T71_001690 [Dendrolimus kikuchii]
MALDPLFGWDLTFKTVEKDVTRKTDVIIAFIHFNLMKRGFRSIGIGDERALAGDEEKSELLPTGWNDKENYTLRYVLDDKLYILHGLNTDGNLIINLMRSEDLVVSNIVVKVDDTVKEMQGSIDKMMPNYKELMFNVKRDLIDTIATRHTSTAETQTSGSAPRRISPQITPRPGPAVQPDHPNVWNPPPEQPFGGIGRSDLDPFMPGGGGMIFNPFGPRRSNENPGLGIPGGLARGAVPPGARFDPFGPPGAFLPSARGRSRPPDSDHLPPPGFENDMFM